LELVQQWLQRVDVDLRSAEADLAAEPPIAEDACFHCQQAVEKLLKAYLVCRGVEFEPTHRIERLINACSKLDGDFVSLHEKADYLSLYGVQYRYPYAEPLPGIEQAKAALIVACEVFQFVAQRLPPEVMEFK
jgi:HEPN domain-containing protein